MGKKEIMRDAGRPAALCNIQANSDEGKNRPFKRLKRIDLKEKSNKELK